MGGMQCYGPVVPEVDEPVFHAEWEKRALALTVAMGFCGVWNIDKSRFARERIAPAQYLSSSYYQIWIAGLERLLAENGLATNEELASGRASEPASTVKRVLTGGDVAAALAAGSPVERQATTKPKFAVGDTVTTGNSSPQGHTRLPRYARGRTGVIEAVHGVHVFPDANAAGEGEQPHWLYAVRFEGVELFGPGNDQQVVVDCWEPYLES